MTHRNSEIINVGQFQLLNMWSFVTCEKLLIDRFVTPQLGYLSIYAEWALRILTKVTYVCSIFHFHTWDCFCSQTTIAPSYRGCLRCRILVLLVHRILDQIKPSLELIQRPRCIHHQSIVQSCRTCSLIPWMRMLCGLCFSRKDECILFSEWRVKYHFEDQ